ALIGVRRAAWMHWVALAQLFFFWLLWAIKLQAALDHPEAIAPELMLAWYLPALGVTFAVLLAASCRSSRPGPFALALPALNVAWAFAAAGAVVLPWLSADRWLGAVALCLAIVHLSLAWLFARRPAADPARATAFVLAAATAFVPATWLLTGSAPAAATTWALLAVGIAWWSGRLGSGGMRAIACCLQVGTTMTAFAAGAFATPPPAPWRAMLLGAALATIAAVHYRWTRATAPREASWYARLSPTDRPGALLLWACIAATFGCLRVAAHPALASMPIDVDNAFSGAESVLLNAIAITLLVLAHRNRSRPALTAAVLVATIGGIKVFASDFFSLHGVPLVLGVFSFGMTAAVASVILGRWQRAVQPAAG
ncbi:MAG TPA: hypothetical protein VFZ65_03060, partial [Planctomycetota bacterium]|nr:hypothetical protein [Planctomycetota bacterium]